MVVRLLGPVASNCVAWMAAAHTEQEGDGARVRRVLVLEEERRAAEVEQPRAEHDHAHRVEQDRDPRDRLRVALVLLHRLVRAEQKGGAIECARPRRRARASVTGLT